MEPPMNADERR